MLINIDSETYCAALISPYMHGEYTQCTHHRASLAAMGHASVDNIFRCQSPQEESEDAVVKYHLDSQAWRPHSYIWTSADKDTGHPGLHDFRMASGCLKWCHSWSICKHNWHGTLLAKDGREHSLVTDITQTLKATCCYPFHYITCCWLQVGCCLLNPMAAGQLHSCLADPSYPAVLLTGSLEQRHAACLQCDLLQ